METIMQASEFGSLKGKGASLEELSKRENHVKKIIIRHPRYQEIFNELRLLYELSKDAVSPEGLFISGPTGAGKTTLLTEFKDLNPRTQEEEFTKIPVLYVKVPPKATPKMLASKILHVIGDIFHDRGTLSNLTSRIHNYVKRCQIKMIVLDEFQHLIDSETDHVLATASNWVKTFAEEIEIPVVLCGMPESEKVFISNEQLDRRFCNKLALTPFSYVEPEDQFMFRKFLAHIDEELPFPERSNIADSHIAEKLFYVSLGIPFYVMEMLVKGTRIAVLRGKDFIDEEVLSQAFQKIKRSGRPFTINPFSVPYFDLDKAIKHEQSAIKVYEEKKRKKKK
ncbi:TniB family NTP-binding protein [Paenibacillus elgii]|uniref:TniB family NTP-binding protein n=1 Tax=Paenibacillus elgii TaxID=189691 RepID=UPI002D7B8EC1|nr:TniB family NTP-binding protein [Paenibacillus elgii]